ncbi:hypothetical protein [Auraticoccus monumenti]|uniref:hypothetical protein n=1 Tax=Auraticoccus monumenti TaxID=675864 RepID=UPI0012F99C27|nr:hypothetical protein [Auraticoccus monumenti]
MTLLQRPGRLTQAVGGVLTVLGVAGFLLSPTVGTVVIGYGMPVGPDSAVLLWGLARTVSAVVTVVGLLVLAFGTGHHLAARAPGRVPR